MLSALLLLSYIILKAMKLALLSTFYRGGNLRFREAE